MQCVILVKLDTFCLFYMPQTLQYLTSNLTKHTQHFISGHVDSGHSEGRVSVCVVFLDGEFPVVETAAETHAPQGDAVLPSLAGGPGAVLRILQSRTREDGIEGEPGN